MIMKKIRQFDETISRYDRDGFSGRKAGYKPDTVSLLMALLRGIGGRGQVCTGRCKTLTTTILSKPRKPVGRSVIATRRCICVYDR